MTGPRPSAAIREGLDALNVFPVPDGDTGANMFLTFEGGHGGLLHLVKAQPDLVMVDAAKQYNRVCRSRREGTPA